MIIYNIGLASSIIFSNIPFNKKIYFMENSISIIGNATEIDWIYCKLLFEIEMKFSISIEELKGLINRTFLEKIFSSSRFF